jgi:peptidase M28-like protein
MMELLKRELIGRGFSITEQRFRATPARLNAVAFLGFAVAWPGGAVLAFGVGEPGSDLSRFVLGGIALVVLLLGTPLRRAFLEGMGGPRSTDAINLLATRAGTPPRVWLAAHYDSKGQVFSMAARLLLVACAVPGAAALVTLAALARVGVFPPAGVWTAAAVCALVGGGPLMLNALLRESPGAVDNATGILTVLGVLDRLPPDAAVGVVLPDAEEWGLLGARALVREHPDLFRDAAVLNFDGIDDRGALVAFVHRPGPTVDAISAALRARRARFLPVVVDGIVLARRAHECVTIMRGDWGTMRVVHTRRDTATRLTLDGVRVVADGVANALRALPVA